MLRVFLTIGLVFSTALGEYIVGRILLPEVGLTAPHYWTWFLVTTVAVVFTIPIVVVREFME